MKSCGCSDPFSNARVHRDSTQLPNRPTRSTQHLGQTTEERLSERIAYQEREPSRLRQAALATLTGGANMRCLAMAYDWVEDGDP